jgi:hypothetical protein
MSTDLLRTLATNFGSNSLLAAKAIREIYRADPVGFPPAAVEVIRDGPELAGTQFLVAILVSSPDWLRSVCDPEKYTLAQSLDLIQRTHKLDPLAEGKLAEILATSGFSTDADARFASRVFAVLKRSSPARVLPALRRLAKCSNAHVRSKAVLMLGRIYQKPKWAQHGVPESDPRVLSNAVEALWGLATPAARESFLKAALDDHYRIAANGIVGLYMMGDECGIPLLFKLSKSESPLARAAAAWAMGHLEDPRFLPWLALVIEGSEPIPRQRAFRSAARVRQRMVQLRTSDTLLVKLHDMECRGSAHEIRVRVTKEDQFVKGLDMRQILVWNGADIVEEFSVSYLDDETPQYEITYQAPPSPTRQVKVQVYAEAGVGEDSGTETEIE